MSSAFPHAAESCVALVREGWAVSLTAAGGQYLARATKGERAVEGRGATQAEALFDACRKAFHGGRA